jgi:hypothetical protein
VLAVYRADRTILMSPVWFRTVDGWIEVADATLTSDGVREARLAIASRYLGDEDGRRYVEQRTKPGVIVRLSLASARTWDLRPILPT